MTTKTNRELDNAVTALQREERVPVAFQQKGGLRLEGLDEAIRFAKGVIQGGMAPRGMTEPGAVVAIIQAGQEIGLPPMFALSNLTFTNGRLGIMGDAAKAVVRSAKVLEKGTEIVTTYTGEPGTLERTATVTTLRSGADELCHTSFSLADALRAGLVKQERDGRIVGARGGSSPWTLYQDRMLSYRAWGFHFRDYFSDVGFGLVVAEELGDYHQGIRERTRALPEEAPREPDPLLAAAVVSPSEEPEEGAETAPEPEAVAQEPAGAEALAGDPAAPSPPPLISAPLPAPEDEAAVAEILDGKSGPLTADEIRAAEEWATPPEIDPETGEQLPPDLPRNPGLFPGEDPE